MRLAVSNIAWDLDEDEAVSQLLRRFAIDAIDVAPGKYFPEPARATDKDIAAVKSWWTERGIEITGMQALLFGTTGLNVFGSLESRTALLDHLAAVCRVGAGLGATRLVFGSPKNRDRTGLTDQETLAIAIPFFKELGDIAQAFGVVVCLEPNPICYGANFMTTSEETLSIVTEVGHPAIKMQLDTGALAINGEDPLEVVQNCAPFIGHVHASDPDLLPVGDGATDHAVMAAAVQQFLPKHLITIEMVATKHEPHISSIERAIQVTIQHYRAGKRSTT